MIEVRDLHKAFGSVKAVDGVTLTVARGEVLGLVGESGCGKSTLARTILQLVPTTGGAVMLEGKNLTAGSADLRVVATRGAYAEALAAFAPHAVVSDYDLPGFSGGEALLLARAHDAAMPFVVLSGFVAEDRPADDRARGADAWVCKDRMHEVPDVLRRLVPA